MGEVTPHLLRRPFSVQWRFWGRSDHQRFPIHPCVAHIVKKITITLLEGRFAALFGVCVCLQTIGVESLGFASLPHTPRHILPRGQILTRAHAPDCTITGRLIPSLVLIAWRYFRTGHSLSRFCRRRCHRGRRRMVLGYSSSGGGRCVWCNNC